MAIKLEITGADAAEFKDQLRGVAEAVLTTSLPGGARLAFAGEDDAEEAPHDTPLPALGKTHDLMDFIVGQMANTIREDQAAAAAADVEKPARKRRTKAEMEADKAAEAAGESGSSAEINTGEKSPELQNLDHAELLAKLAGAPTLSDLGNLYHSQPERIDGNLALRTAMLTRQHHFTGARGGGEALPGGKEAEAEPETAAPAQEVTAPAPTTDPFDDPFLEVEKVTPEELRAFAIKVRDANGDTGKAAQMLKLQALQSELIAEGLLTETQKSFSNVPDSHCAAVLTRLKALG